MAERDFEEGNNSRSTHSFTVETERGWPLIFRRRAVRKDASFICLIYRDILGEEKGLLSSSRSLQPVCRPVDWVFKIVYHTARKIQEPS